MSYLELTNIHKSYQIGKQKFDVLKGINLQFELGEFVAIVGESGGGKTTLVNIISGLDHDFAGQSGLQDSYWITTTRSSLTSIGVR